MIGLFPDYYQDTELNQAALYDFILAPLNLNKNNQTKRIEDLLFLGRINDDGIKNILLLEQEKLQREIINKYSLKSNKNLCIARSLSPIFSSGTSKF